MQATGWIEFIARVTMEKTCYRHWSPRQRHTQVIRIFLGGYDVLETILVEITACGVIPPENI
jgi:hypothetical protein